MGAHRGAALGRRARGRCHGTLDDVGEDDARHRRIGVFAAGSRLERHRGGGSDDVGGAVAEQRAVGVAVLDLWPGLDMLQPRRHVEQVSERDRRARIAGAHMPRRHRGGRIEPQPPGVDELPDKRRGDGFGHRPADEARRRAIARSVALGDRLAVLQHDDGTGLRQPWIGEEAFDERARGRSRRCTQQCQKDYA